MNVPHAKRLGRNELSCGAHVALRSTSFCALWRREPAGNPTECEGDKAFVMHSIGYQMTGGWVFHGKKSPELVHPGTVIGGSPGQHYGCKHRVHKCDSVCGISLLPGALDETDEPIFDKQVLNGLELPVLGRMLAMEDDDQFESLVFRVFDYVSRVSLSDSRALARPSFRVQRMKRFVERHAFEDIALSDIARCLGLSPFTCIRVFKSATGLTPLNYLSRVRFERAQVLLRNRKLTIAEVGRRVGIRDRHYFSRWFSKAAGVPPNRFRRIIDR